MLVESFATIVLMAKKNETEQPIDPILNTDTPPPTSHHTHHAKAEPTSEAAAELPESNKKNPSKKHHRFFHWPPSKWEIVGIVVILILAVGGVTYGLTRPSKPKPIVPIAKSVPMIKAPAPTTVASTLTGLPVAPDVNQRPVTGIMIENSTFARPQSGLAEAGVVFEAVAEGGITRFLALYQDTQPGYIGPIRSARPYYLQWDLGFDAPLAHVGGSPEAIQDIATWGVKNLDQFYNGSYYTRITSRDAPHNVYTSIAELNALEQTKGYTSSSFTGFPRKADSPAKTPNATSINLSPSSADYAVSYSYNASTNSYLRSEGGQPQMDVDQNSTQTQVAPKVVVALIMQQGLEADGEHTTYNVIGSGQVYVFQDGTVTTGTWQKTANNTQLTFTNAQGAPLKLNAGQTWITALGSASDVTYTT